MKQLSSPMLEVLDQLRRGTTTASGYTRDTRGRTYIAPQTVGALIRRGLLEPCGEICSPLYLPNEGQGEGSPRMVPVYRISAQGRTVAQEASSIRARLVRTGQPWNKERKQEDAHENL